MTRVIRFVEAFVFLLAVLGVIFGAVVAILTYVPFWLLFTGCLVSIASIAAWSYANDDRWHVENGHESHMRRLWRRI